jgi:hypothetical protein
MSKISQSGKAILSLLAIGFVIAFGSATFSVGQSSPQPMYTSQVAVDNHCDDDGTICSVPGSNCTEVIITPTGSGNFYLHTWISCPGGGCGGCYACAYVTKVANGAIVLGPDHTGCPPCDHDNIGPAWLDQGQNYRLVVCKKPCVNHDCAQCESDCLALAQVHG